LPAEDAVPFSTPLHRLPPPARRLSAGNAVPWRRGVFFRNPRL
jgi:hypothetical protein